MNKPAIPNDEATRRGNCLIFIAAIGGEDNLNQATHTPENFWWLKWHSMGWYMRREFCQIIHMPQLLKFKYWDKLSKQEQEIVCIRTKNYAPKVQTFMRELNQQIADELGLSE